MSPTYRKLQFARTALFNAVVAFSKLRDADADIDLRLEAVIKIEAAAREFSRAWRNEELYARFPHAFDTDGDPIPGGDADEGRTA